VQVSNFPNLPQDEYAKKSHEVLHNLVITQKNEKNVVCVHQESKFVSKK